jgi:hypothetical protein
MQVVSAAQAAMEANNFAAQWVLKGLRRNFMLSWRPDLSKGALVPCTGNPEQAWSEDMPEGSSRLRASWYEDRLRWRDSEGKPYQPNWALSEVAREVSDLIEWDYQHPEELQEGTEALDWDLVGLSEELALEVETARLFQLAPALRRAAKRRAEDKTFAELRERRKGKAQARTAVRLLRRRLSATQKQELRLKLADKSRGDALAQLVPAAGKKAKAQTGKLLKKSLKKHLKKKQLKHPGGSGKLAKKQAAKDKLKEALTTAALALKGQEAKEAAEPLPLPPVPPPEEPPEEPAGPPEEEPASLKGKTLRVVSEAGGVWKYGLQGTCSSHNLSTGAVNLTAGLSTVETLAAHCVLAEGFEKTKPWRSQSGLSRLDKQELLSKCGLTLTADDHSVEELRAVTQATTLLDDHQVHLGLHLLAWGWGQGALKGLRFVDPLLSKRLLLSLQDTCPEVTATQRQALLSHKQGAKRLLVPVFGDAPGHWTLLSLELAEDGSLSAVRYRDSLQDQHSGCTAAAEQLLSILSEGQHLALPARSNWTYQAAGSDMCGFWVLVWAEDEAAEHSGEGPAARGLPQPRLKGTRARLVTLTKLLEAEQKKSEADQEDERAKYAKKLAQAKEKAKALAAKNSSKKDAAEAALQAVELLAAGGTDAAGGFSAANLSEFARASILRAASGVGVCSKCRWQSGCLNCDRDKAQRHFLEKERLQWALKRLQDL